MEAPLSSLTASASLQLDTLADICLFTFVGILIIILLVLVARLLGTSLRKIPEGEVAIVERLGLFSRVAGPGLVWITPGLEYISRTLNVRLREEQFVTRGLWFRDMVPVDVDFTVCYRLDLHSLKPDLRRQVAYYSPEQWHSMVEGRIARVLQDVISKCELMELIGNDQSCRVKVEHDFTRSLEPELKEWGIDLGQPKGVWLRGVELPEELRKALTDIRRTEIDIKTRGAIVEKILKRYPGLSDVALLSLLNMIGGRGQELISIFPYPITSIAGKEVTPEEKHAEVGGKEQESSSPEPELGDSWRSVKSLPERSESGQVE
jgi:regulator of protease activity HflC (stomatin/prohibitin superfamily)